MVIFNRKLSNHICIYKKRILEHYFNLIWEILSKEISGTGFGVAVSNKG
jgi:hypothetical protein